MGNFYFNYNPRLVGVVKHFPSINLGFYYSGIPNESLSIQAKRALTARGSAQLDSSCIYHQKKGSSKIPGFLFLLVCSFFKKDGQKRVAVITNFLMRQVHLNL